MWETRSVPVSLPFNMAPLKGPGPFGTNLLMLLSSLRENRRQSARTTKITQASHPSAARFPGPCIPHRGRPAFSGLRFDSPGCWEGGLRFLRVLFFGHACLTRTKRKKHERTKRARKIASIPSKRPMDLVSGLGVSGPGCFEGSNGPTLDRTRVHAALGLGGMGVEAKRGST